MVKFGLKFVDTRYVLILNPDTICEKNFFPNIETFFKKNIDFSIIGATYKNQQNFHSSGYFEENINPINAVDQNGNNITLEQYQGKKVVLYLYPKDQLYKVF